MSWNEPGGDKKDPWSGQNKEEGPPDIDEAIRSMQEKLGKWFGSGNSGGTDENGLSPKAFGLAAIVALLVWAATGIYIVDQGNRGVVTRFGKYVETTEPGPHWRFPTPIESVDVVNVEQQRFIEVGYRSSGRQQAVGTVAREALMLTKDENIVDVRLAVQYQIKDAKDFVFNVKGPSPTLKQVVEAAERGVIGKSTMDFVLTEGRSEIASEVAQEIQTIMDNYGTGVHVTSVNLQDAQPPEEVQGAFEDAIKAREDEQRLINEAEAYSNEVIPKARGAAARMTQEAEGYQARVIAQSKGESSRFRQLLTEYEKAPAVTRNRLYIEAMESVLSKTETVMVDVKGGNNLLYLPLDKLRGADASKNIQRSRPAAVDRKPAVRSTTGLRTSSRGREGRSR